MAEDAQQKFIDATDERVRTEQRLLGQPGAGRVDEDKLSKEAKAELKKVRDAESKARNAAQRGQKGSSK